MGRFTKAINPTTAEKPKGLMSKAKAVQDSVAASRAASQSVEAKVTHADSPASLIQNVELNPAKSEAHPNLEAVATSPQTQSKTQSKTQSEKGEKKAARKAGRISGKTSDSTLKPSKKSSKKQSKRAALNPAATSTAQRQSPQETTKAPSWLQAKIRIHNRIIDTVDLSDLDKGDLRSLRAQVNAIVKELAVEEKLKLNAVELMDFSKAIIDEMTGLGPLEPLLQDETVSDILINGHQQVYVEQGGELELSDVHFADDNHLLRIINRIVAKVGRRVDESQPMVDARLTDGSRVNVAIAPIAVDGPLVSIRKFSKKPLTLDKLVEFQAIPEVVAQFIYAACRARVTIVISGGTGSGKTTLLNALSQSISEKERLITIEDAAELQLQQPHVARMETRPPNVEGKGEIRQRELVKNALRMRPDRVILGEVRGEEAFDMLQAMNTGHEGSLATLHANTPRDAITRLEQMVAMGDMKITPEAVAGQIASAVGLIVQAQRLSDGQRKITSVAEITGMEGATIQMQEVFNYTRTGTTEDNKVIGEFRATGIRPKCLEEIITRGINVGEDIFEPGRIEAGKFTNQTIHEFVTSSASED